MIDLREDGNLHGSNHPNNRGINQMLNYVRAFLKDEEGLTMVEYAIAGALVAAATVTAFTGLGTQIIDRINNLASDVAA